MWAGVLLVSVVAVALAGDQGPERRARPLAAAIAHPGTAALPRFALFGWVAPPIDQTTPERYQQMADAGFNVTVLAWEDPGTPGFNRQRLAVTPAGLRNLLLDNRLDLVHEDDAPSLVVLDSIVAAYRDDPGFLGYYLGDEPGVARYPRLAEWFRLLRARDPLHPAWNNLLGRSMFNSHDEFIDYLRGYVTTVQPAVLCTDHYDHLDSGDRGQFVASVAGTAQVAREAGLPFWGVLLVTRHLQYRYVDDALLRWQVAQWLAYGARGIGYFTYWQPAPDPDPVVNWQEGMIRYDNGDTTAHYTRVRELNRRVLPLGEALAGLAWISTEYSGDVPEAALAFSPDLLVSQVEGRAALGTFAAADGTPHLFVANRDSSAARVIALELVGERPVERLSDAGAWTPYTSTPTSNGRRVELSLAAGDFALLRVGGACPDARSGTCRAALSGTPEPAFGRVRLGASALSGVATITICDVTGRRVWSRSLQGDAPVIEWDGRDDAGARVRPGPYWARLADARGAVVRRITWLGSAR